MENDFFDLIKDGRIEGFSGTPKIIETVISRVFVFNEDNIVLKFYKRDNGWWNTAMNDLSRGASRRNFIRRDFEFNHFLNPKVYFALKTVVLNGKSVALVEPKNSDDELVIVMRKEDLSGVLTDVLYENKLVTEEYKSIGTSFAEIKLALPKHFLSDNRSSWYDQMRVRLSDLSNWLSGASDFPKVIADAGLSLLRESLEENKESFQLTGGDDFFPLIDCNSENLLYSDGKLRFIDAYPPKDDWRMGTFDVDIFRVAGDIYALAGKNAYDAYLKGVDEVAGEYRNKNLSDFYLLYGVMIMAPYLFMLSKKDTKYEDKAKKYLEFVEKLLGFNTSG